MRSLRRVGASLSTLTLQGAIFVLLTVLVVMTCNEIRPATDIQMALAGDPDAGAAILFGLVALPLAIGVWLTAGLGHWPRGTPWLIFPLFPLLLLTIATIVRRIVEVGEPPDPAWALWGGQVVILVTIMVIALAGIPVGRACRAVHDSAVRWLWRTRRHRMRHRSPR